MPDQNIRMLIVDDDATMSRYLTAYFARRNFEVNTASSGEEAIRMFRSFDPSVVLLDISMPGMDGIEATEKLVEMNLGVRVVMLTSYSEREKITEALAAGAVSYLTTDSPPDAVIRAIRSAAASDAAPN